MSSLLPYFFKGGQRPLRLLLALLLGLAGPVAHAQAPAWQNAVSLTNSYGGTVHATTTDASGNVYLAGSFNGRVTLDTVMKSK